MNIEKFIIKNKNYFKKKINYKTDEILFAGLTYKKCL